jgi:serine/threonine-protein kinase
MAAPMKIEAGQRIADRFVIERTLGAGGMGAVFLARDEKLGEPVALKLVRDVQATDAQTIDRFRREVSAARRISHPNVVRLHDLGESQGVIFISMEYVEGDSLRAVMRRNGMLPPDRVRSIVAQICDGLEAAHAAGVVHRDLKPENVLFSSSQQVKLIDFGIAKLSDLEGMTATRIILGTPHYMAPEQIRGKPIDARVDLYALGVLAFEALAGSPPYDGPSPIAISFAHCNDPIPSLKERISLESASRGDDVPSAWEAFVRKALAKDPSDRFDSAAAMRGALPRSPARATTDTAQSAQQ